jgi:hypothetical protein
MGLSAGVVAACGTGSGASGTGSAGSVAGAASGGASGTAGSSLGASGATGGPSGAAAGSLGVAGSSSGVGSLSGAGSLSGSAAPPGADGGACASVSYQSQTVPVDIFIMMDQSGSMTDMVTGPNGTMGQKWDFLKQAFTTFVEDPTSVGLGIGIQYFPIPNVDDSSCDAGTYAVTNDPSAPPSGIGVAIAPLPGNAMPIVDSLNAHTPGGQTPTVAALSGALQYAQTWIAQNPSHKVVVVFATDGSPHGCTNNTIDVAAGVAQAAVAASPSIPTYVIGVGSSLSSLNTIADAGGTGAALIVNTNQDVAAQFVAAMNAIRSSTSLPCTFTIPPSDGGAVDIGKVNVVDAPDDGGAPVPLLQVSGETACDPASGGWYYDNPLAPSNIDLCPASCSVITTQTTTQVDIQLGCRTLVAPPR